MMDNAKVLCETPTPGKQPTKIDRWKYEVVRRAILETLSVGGEGVLFKELPARVAERLSDEERHNLGSVSWYTTTVKLDLEVKGEIARLPGSKPQRIIRKQSGPAW